MVTLVLTVVLPIAGAAAAVIAGALGRPRVAGAVACGALALSFVAALAMTQAFAAGKGSLVAELGPWLPLSGADLALRLDPPMMPLVLALTGASALVCAASLAARQRPVAHVASPVLVAATLVILTASNLVLLLAGWELAAFAAYALLGERADRAAAADAARASFAVARLGDVALVVGTLGLLTVLRTVDLQELRARVEAAPVVPGAVEALGWSGALLLVAAIARSAQLPLHRWLVDATEAPAPSLALVRAVALAPAGAVLLVRIAEIVPQGVLAAGTVAGAATAVVAAVGAHAQHEPRRASAWIGIAQLGVVFAAVGTGNTFVALLLLLVHVLALAALSLLDRGRTPSGAVARAALAVAAVASSAFVVGGPLAGRRLALALSSAPAAAGGAAVADAAALALAAAAAALPPLAVSALSLGVARDPLPAPVVAAWATAAIGGLVAGYLAARRRPAPLARAAGAVRGVRALDGWGGAALAAVTRTLERGTEEVLGAATDVVALAVEMLGSLAAAAHRAPLRVSQAVLLTATVALAAFWIVR